MITLFPTPSRVSVQPQRMAAEKKQAVAPLQFSAKTPTDLEALRSSFEAVLSGSEKSRNPMNAAFSRICSRILSSSGTPLKMEVNPNRIAVYPSAGQGAALRAKLQKVGLNFEALPAGRDLLVVSLPAKSLKASWAALKGVMDEQNSGVAFWCPVLSDVTAESDFTCMFTHELMVRYKNKPTQARLEQLQKQLGNAAMEPSKYVDTEFTFTLPEKASWLEMVEACETLKAEKGTFEFVTPNKISQFKKGV